MFFPFVFGIGLGILIDQKFEVPRVEPYLRMAIEKLKECEKKEDKEDKNK